MSQDLTITVVIPTYRRPEQLRQCVLGLARQLDPPDEVIVVVRVSDDESLRLIRSMDREIANLRVVFVDEPGVVAAMRRGVEYARTELIAFTDDDAIPSAMWIRALRAAFGASDIGLVGGRDIIEGTEADCPIVGRFGRWGRRMGNHHRGTGPPREVDVLKGVNMAARVQALSVPLGLRGSGSQPHWEVATCLEAASRGWRVLYDPAITVEHFPAARGRGDERELLNARAVFDETFNYHVALAGTQPRLAARVLLYGIVIGTTRSPGVLRWVVALVRCEPKVLSRVGPAMQGRLAGHRAGKRGGLNMWDAASSNARG